MALSDKQEELCRTNPVDHSNLRAVYINCTLKRPDQSSHTELLMSTSAEIMR